MSFWGLTIEDYKSEFPDVDVWPDNWQAVCFFAALGNGSWNMGPSGPTGLRYESFREVRIAHGIRATDWPELFESICVMEAAALEEIHADED